MRSLISLCLSLISDERIANIFTPGRFSQT